MSASPCSSRPRANLCQLSNHTLSASKIAAGGRNAVFLLIRVVLQSVQCARLLLQDLLEVGYKYDGVLDRLAQALDTGLDVVAQFIQPAQLLLFTRLISISELAWHFSANHLVQNCNTMIEIWTLSQKCWKLGLSGHGSTLYKCEVLAQLFHLGPDVGDEVCCSVVSLAHLIFDFFLNVS